MQDGTALGSIEGIAVGSVVEGVLVGIIVGVRDGTALGSNSGNIIVTLRIRSLSVSAMYKLPSWRVC